MPHYLVPLLLVLVAPFAAMAAGPGHSGPQATAGTLEISAVRAPASLGAARNGVIHLAVRNTGDQPDALLGARSAVADRTELHTHIHTDGIMRMRRADRFGIPAGGMLDLRPGGNHIMLVKLHEPLVTGRQFDLTLVFERAGTVDVRVEVVPLGSRHQH